MRPWRTARRLVDPWAGLLLAALIVLAVVILLATPGPWRTVVGPQAPVDQTTGSPSDLCLFVLAGSAEERCSAVAWLHLEHEPSSAALVLVPPRTRCAVPGGGFAPIRRLVTDLDAAVASDALGDALGVTFDGWVTLDREAIHRFLQATRGPGDTREGLRDYTEAAAALSAPAHGLDGLRRQHLVLAQGLRAVRFADLPANAFANYLLGSNDVTTDMDLRAVSAVARALRSLGEESVAVRTAPAIVEACGTARSWRLDESRLEPVRRSLSLGLKPPPSQPRIMVRAVAAEVLVVCPPGVDGGVLSNGLHEALVEGAGARPHDVRIVTVDGESAGARLAVLVARRRPLAVVLAPWAVDATEPSPATTPEALQQAVGDSTGWSAEGINAAAQVLANARQPAVLIAPPVGAPDELGTAAEESGLPLAGPLPDAVTASNDGIAQEAPWSRLLAAAVGRACWPEYLAPSLAGTRLEFSYAARRGTEVAVTGARSADLAAWLAACGYATVEVGSGWEEPAGPAIAFRSGARRAALSAADDVGWPAATLVRDRTAPATLTVVTTLP